MDVNGMQENIKQFYLDSSKKHLKKLPRSLENAKFLNVLESDGKYDA